MSGMGRSRTAIVLALGAASATAVAPSRALACEPLRQAWSIEETYPYAGAEEVPTDTVLPVGRMYWDCCSESWLAVELRLGDANIEGEFLDTVPEYGVWAPLEYLAPRTTYEVLVRALDSPGIGDVIEELAYSFTTGDGPAVTTQVDGIYALRFHTYDEMVCAEPDVAACCLRWEQLTFLAARVVVTTSATTGLTAVAYLRAGFGGTPEEASGTTRRTEYDVNQGVLVVDHELGRDCWWSNKQVCVHADVWDFHGNLLGEDTDCAVAPDAGECPISTIGREPAVTAGGGCSGVAVPRVVAALLVGGCIGRRTGRRLPRKAPM